MIPKVSAEVYKQVEQESHSDPYGFLDRIWERTERANPEIQALIDRWFNQYENQPWVGYSIGYAGAVYRMLELTLVPLPIVMPQTAKPLFEEFVENANGPGAYFKEELARLLVENPFVAMAAAWSTFDAVVMNDKKAMAMIPILGLAVYRYIEKESELDNSPKEPSSLF